MKRRNILCVFRNNPDLLAETVKQLCKMLGSKNVFFNAEEGMIPEITVVCDDDDWERVKAYLDCWRENVM